MRIPAWHYDGQSAVRQEVVLDGDGSGFSLILDEGIGRKHAWDDLVYRDEKPEGPVYGHARLSGWQIGLTDPIPDEIRQYLPRQKRYGGIIDKIGLFPAASVFLAISAVAILVVMQVPSALAPLVPMSWEKKLGDTLVGDFGGRFCEGPASDAALATLSKRLEPDGTPLSVRIANIDMVNAVALPGGNIVIFRGLLQEAKSPDELAGVLGHEMGHVRNRDVMESLLRQLGISVLLGGANTDAAGYLKALVSSAYSRDAETAADRYAIERMQKAGIAPADTAGFFARLASDEKKLGAGSAALGYLSSHPLSKDREKMFRDSALKGAAHTPALTPQQWRAVVEACANDPDVEGDGGLFF